MGDNTNKYSDLTGTDYIAGVSIEFDENVIDLGSQKPVPRAGLPVSNSVNISDSSSVNPNSRTASDSVNVTDAASSTSQNTGTFVIGTAQIEFSDIG